MRKISREMVTALRNGNSMCKSNTQVTSNGAVSLFGVHIATLRIDGLSITDCGGWRTSTTTERLNALLRAFASDMVHVFMRKGEFYYSINGEVEKFAPRTFDLK